MADTYKPMRAFELNDDMTEVVGKSYFIIGGEMADGTKCWYKCDKDGYREMYDTRWYTMHNMCGHKVAIFEGE